MMSVHARAATSRVFEKAVALEPFATMIPPARVMFPASCPAEVEYFDAHEKGFFYSIRLKNGTRKFTYGSRLDELNEHVNRLLASHDHLRVMDVAVSSGISTLEWSESMDGAGISHQMVAGDVCVECDLISLGNWGHVLVGPSGYSLQYEVLGRVFPNPVGRRNLAKFLVPVLLLRCAALLHSRSKKDTGRPRAKSLGASLLKCRRISLVNPRLHNHPRIDVVEDDILGPSVDEHRFDVVRAANILNRIYFDEGTLRKMLAALRVRLRDGGYLIVCRTDNYERTSGTVFVKNERGLFQAVSRLNGGSDIEDLVLRLEA